MRLTKFAAIFLWVYIAYTNLIVWVFVAAPFLSFHKPQSISNRSYLGEAIILASAVGWGLLMWSGKRCGRTEISKMRYRLAYSCLFAGLLLATSMYFMYASATADADIKKMWLAQAVGMLAISWFVLCVVFRRSHKFTSVSDPVTLV